MVEVARLESVYRVKPIGGSNPPLSAKIKYMIFKTKADFSKSAFSLSAL